MKIEELEKNLKQEKLECLYLLYGEERFLLENSLKKIKKIFGELLKGINYVIIDETNVNDIISNIETPCFGFEKKLMVIKNTGLFKKELKTKKKAEDALREKIVSYINENIEVIKETVVLVFIEQEAEKNSLYELIEKNGIVCNFEHQDQMKIIARLKGILVAYKVNAENSTLAYLIENCGTDMQELINETRKLIEYAGEGNIIEKKDIDELCNKKVESVIFDLTDKLGQKNTKAAIEILRNLILSKEPLQLILINLYNHFKKLYLVKIAIKNNLDIASSLKLKPNQKFLVGKYRKQSEYFKERELRNIIQKLCDLDYKYKIGLIDLNVGLESIICAYI